MKKNNITGLGLFKCAIINNQPENGIIDKLSISNQHEEFEPEPIPEIRLLRSVLLRAYADAIGRLSSGIIAKDSVKYRLDSLAAREWFAYDGMVPFSFLWVAEYLDLTDSFISKLRAYIQYVHENKVEPESLPTFKVFQARFGD